MPRRPARRRQFPAAAEVCEPRCLLTTFVVTDGGDVTAEDGVLTYREALTAAEAEAGADVITFAEGVDVVTLEADLGAVAGDLSVVADAAGVIIDHAGFSGLELTGGAYAFSDVTFAGADIQERPVLDLSGGATLTVTGGGFLNNTQANAFLENRVVRLTDSDGTFTGVRFEGNRTGGRGGIGAFGGSELRLVDVTAVRNEGGVVFAAVNEPSAGSGPDGDPGDPAPTVTITGGTFGLNDSDSTSANVTVRGGSLTVTGGRYTRNNGGVFDATDADVTVTGGYYGLNTNGGIAVSYGTFAIADVTMSSHIFDSALAAIGNDATITDCLFFRNETGALAVGSARDRTESGGGDGRSSVVVAGCTFTRNVDLDGGAVTASGGSLSLIDVRMFSNAAEDRFNASDDPFDSGKGGAVLVRSGAAVTVEGGRYAQNFAERLGGAFYVSSDAESLSIANTSINRNLAGFSGSNELTGGGGVYVAARNVNDPRRTGVSLTIDDVFAARNVAAGDRGRGGALHARGATVRVSGSNFAGNSADDSGGGVYLRASDATFTDTFVRGGRADRGAGVDIAEGDERFAGDDGANRSVVRFVGGGLIGNEATGAGGGLRLNGGFGDPNVVTLDGARVRGNRANRGGAAFVAGAEAGGRLTVTGETILRNNRAAELGGGFAVQGRLKLDGVTAVGSRARDAGDVAYAFGDGRVTVLDAVFRGSDDPLAGPGDIRDRR